MRKIVAIILLPLVVLLIILQALWEATKLFCSSTSSGFSDAYQYYVDLFSFAKSDEEESDWWNFS